MVDTRPVLILGAGAAGIMAAIFAAGRGRRVLVLERTRDGGRKILVSGGGRCNILPSVTEPSRFVTDSSPNTLRKILTSWPLEEQRRFFVFSSSLVSPTHTFSGAVAWRAACAVQQAA